jgi:hypothetical protein
VVTGTGGTAVHDAVAEDLGRAERPGRPRPGPITGTTVITGGRVFTADPARPWAEAVAFRGRRIVAVGDSAGLLAAHPDARVVDVGGRLVIPGLNDAHMHHTPDPAGVRLRTDDRVEPTREEILAAVAEAATATPPGTWLFGTMGMTLITDDSFDRDALDPVAPEHPVILLGMTNHTTVVNGAALSRLGLDGGGVGDSDDRAGAGPFRVLGGTCRRDAAGRPTGRIDEYASWTPQNAFAAMTTTAEGAESIRALTDACLRWGVTSIQNMSWTPARRYLDMAARAQVPLRIRVVDFPATGRGARHASEPTAERAAAAQATGARVSWTGRKWILDGTLVEAGASMSYVDGPGRGVQNFAPPEVDAMLAESVAAGDQLLLHAIGTDAVQLVVDALDRAGPQDWAARHLRLEHADCATPDQLTRLRDHGAMVVQNPMHFLVTEMYVRRLGAGHPYALFRSLFVGAEPGGDAGGVAGGVGGGIGIEVGIGSDGPLNPYIGISGALVHPTRPDEAVDVAQVLTAYTVGSARAEGTEADKGRLAPGYLADLAVLSQDLFTTPADRVPATESVLTVVDGQVEYCTLPLG